MQELICYYCEQEILQGEAFTQKVRKKDNKIVYLHVEVDCPVARQAAIAAKEKECGNSSRT